MTETTDAAHHVWSYWWSCYEPTWSTLLILSVPTILGSVLITISAVVNSFEAIILGRFIVGISAGAYTVVAPTYLSEVAPPESRGAAGIVNQIVTVFAILLSQVLGLPQVMITLLKFYFRSLCPACLLHVICDKQAAKEGTFLIILLFKFVALLVLRGRDYDTQMELDSLHQDLEFTGVHQLSMKDFFRSLICDGQLSGINGVFYYSVLLFKNIGLTNNEASLVNLGVGATILLATIVSVFIVDRGGRRMLLLIGFSVCLFSLIVFTTLLVVQKYTQTSWLMYISILVLYLFVSGFAIGPGSIPWFLVAELFTQEHRDSAASVAVGVNWLCNIIVGLVFPQLLAVIDMYAFVPFVCVLTTVIVLIALYLPETKGFSPIYTESIFKAQVRHSSVISNFMA
ncbi:unnamed protein product [Heterobilharzia americana]|nr:unnamed protein product [Heterobilharzia americana]